MLRHLRCLWSRPSNRRIIKELLSTNQTVERRLVDLARRVGCPSGKLTSIPATIRWLRNNEWIGEKASKSLKRTRTLTITLSQGESIAPNELSALLRAANRQARTLANIENDISYDLVSLSTIAVAIGMPVDWVTTQWENAKNPAPYVLRKGQVKFHPAKLKTWARQHAVALEGVNHA